MKNKDVVNLHEVTQAIYHGTGPLASLWADNPRLLVKQLTQEITSLRDRIFEVDRDAIALVDTAEISKLHGPSKMMVGTDQLCNLKLTLYKNESNS